jgi:hypothetical protein
VKNPFLIEPLLPKKIWKLKDPVETLAAAIAWAFVFGALIFCLIGCQHAPQKRPNSPDLSAAVTQNKGISSGISSAQSDNKEIKRAVGRLQGSNKTLRQNNTDILSGLDRADYKVKLLLQK